MPDRDWWSTEWDRSEYDRERYEAAKAKLIELLGGRCAECGTSGDLQFDHVNRELKEFAITEKWNRSQEELAAELAKCQLLCRTHHLEKTRIEVSVDHGGGVSGKRNCPCTPCRTKKSEYNQNYRLARKTS